MAEPPDWIDTSRFTYDKADTSSSDEDSSSPSRLVIDAASAGEMCGCVCGCVWMLCLC